MFSLKRVAEKSGDLLSLVTLLKRRLQGQGTEIFGFKVLGFRVWGLGFRVQGLGFSLGI